MRVLQVSSGTLYGQSPGGAERCCLELSRWLAAAGVDVLIATPAGAGAQPFPAMTPLRQATWKPLRKLLFDYVSPGNARRLRRTIAEFRPDIVHFHNIYGIGSQLIRAASETVRTVVTVHDYWPVDVFVPRATQAGLRYPRRQQFAAPWVWAHRAVHRSSLQGATLVSPSKYLARRLEHHGYRAVRVIPNGVELPAETSAGEARVLFVGRLVPEKGLREVLPAIGALAGELGWQVDIVGDGPLRGELERSSRAVTFRGWADPLPYYRRAGIVVMPSLWPENFGYVALEAMACGLPVLASHVGGIPEIVQDGVTGVLYEPDDPEQFTSSLRKLAGDETLRGRLGRAARERIAREFTWASIGPRYLSLYEEMVPSRAHSGVTTQAV